MSQLGSDFKQSNPESLKKHFQDPATSIWYPYKLLIFTCLMWSMYSVGMLLAGLGVHWEAYTSIAYCWIVLWVLQPHRKPPDKPHEPKFNIVFLPKNLQNFKKKPRHFKFPNDKMVRLSFRNHVQAGYETPGSK